MLIAEANPEVLAANTAMATNSTSIIDHLPSQPMWSSAARGARSGPAMAARLR